MGSFRILDGEVLPKAEFLQRLQAGAAEAGDEAPPASLKGDIVEAALSADQPGAAQFVPVGLGRPLTVLLRHIYTGRHPKAGILGGAKQMAVVTGVKDYAAFAAASRAINFLEKNTGPGTHFRAPTAFNQGTAVVAYCPAVVTDSLTFSVEIAFDRFPDKLFTTISKGLSAAAGIPLLIPAQGYLLGASQLLKLGTDWADALIDGKAAFSSTDTLDFNIPGVVPPKADFRVLTQGWDPTGMTYVPGKGLVDAGGAVYAGDQPYVVISIDGAERKNLESFAPTLASAEVLKQFLHMSDGGEASVEALLGAFRLANDMKFRNEALSLKPQLDAEKDVVKKKALQDRYDALRKNVLSDELKPAQAAAGAA